MPSLYEIRKAKLDARQAAIEEHRRQKTQRNTGHPYCWMKFRGPHDTGYHGPRIRRAILSTLTTEWMEWGDLLHALREKDGFCNCPYRINHVLGLLLDCFRIEKQPIYVWPRSNKEPYPSLEQRMSRPPGKTLGYHDAYRLMTVPRNTIIQALTATDQGKSTHEVAALTGIRWDMAFELSLHFRFHQCPHDQLHRLISLATKNIPAP